MKFFVVVAAIAVVVNARPDISLAGYDYKPPSSGFNVNQRFNADTQTGASGFNTFATSAPVIRTSYQQPASGLVFTSVPTQQTFGPTTTVRGNAGFNGATYSTGFVAPVQTVTTTQVRGGFGDSGFGNTGFASNGFSSGAGTFGTQQTYAAPTVTTTQVRGGFGNTGFSGAGNFGTQQSYVAPTVTQVRGGNTGFSSGNTGFGGQYVAPVQTVTTTQVRGGNTGFSSGNTGFSSGNTGFSSGKTGGASFGGQQTYVAPVQTVTTVRGGNTGFSSGNTGFTSGNTGFSSGNTGFSSGASGQRFGGSTGFGSGQATFSGNQGFSGHSHGSSGHHHQKTTFIQQKPIITKHFYVHAAPEEDEDYTEARQITLPAPQKHYKIVFIKAPTYSSHRSQIIAQQAQTEEKTLIYVLVKKPEDTEDVDIQTAKALPPSKPEVFFIKYKGNDAHKKIQQTLKETEVRFGDAANQGTTFVTGGQQGLDAITNNDFLKNSITSIDTKPVSGGFDSGFDISSLTSGGSGSSFTSGNTGSSGSGVGSSSVGSGSAFGTQFVSQDFGSVQPTGATFVTTSSAPVSSGFSNQFVSQDFGSVQPTGATFVTTSSAPAFVTTSSAPAFVTSSIAPTFVADNSVDTRFALSGTTGVDNIGYVGGATKFATIQEPPTNYGPPDFHAGQPFKRASKI